MNVMISVIIGSYVSAEEERDAIFSIHERECVRRAVPSELAYGRK